MMMFVTFDMCLADPLTHSHSSEKDVDRVTGLQGASTNNVEVLLSGGPLPGDELDMGALVWLVFTVRWESGASKLCHQSLSLFCSLQGHHPELQVPTTLVHRDIKPLHQDHSQRGVCSCRCISQGSLEKQNQQKCIRKNWPTGYGHRKCLHWQGQSANWRPRRLLV